MKGSSTPDLVADPAEPTSEIGPELIDCSHSHHKGGSRSIIRIVCFRSLLEPQQNMGFGVLGTVHSGGSSLGSPSAPSIESQSINVPATHRRELSHTYSPLCSSISSRTDSLATLGRWCTQLKKRNHDCTDYYARSGSYFYVCYDRGTKWCGQYGGIICASPPPPPPPSPSPPSPSPPECGAGSSNYRKQGGGTLCSYGNFVTSREECLTAVQLLGLGSYVNTAYASGYTYGCMILVGSPVNATEGPRTIASNARRTEQERR